MDFETQRKKRQEVLDEKRKRLDEMKKKKETTLSAITTTSIPAVNITNVLSPGKKDNSLISDDYLTSILTSTGAPDGKSDESQKNNIASYTQEKMKNLVTVKGNANVNIFPVIPVTYSKSVQTDEATDYNAAPDSPGNLKRNISSGSPSTPTKEATSGNIKPATTEKKGAWGKLKGHIVAGNPKPGMTDAPSEYSAKLASERETKKKLSEDEINAILSNKEFNKFINFSGLVIERALSQIELTSDIVRDYTKEGGHHAKKLAEIKPLELFAPYEEESLKYRPVMDLKYNPTISGLFLAAYGARSPPQQNHSTRSSITQAPSLNSTVEDDAPGMVCVWSKALHKRPEFKFIAASPVLTAIFHSSDQSLIIGGCYSGQILLWDSKMRSLPIQRSNMAGKGHKHPVYAISMIGSTVSNQLISISTDAMICQWDLNRLAEPQTVSFLNFSNPLLNPSTSVSTFSMADETSQFSANPLNVSCMTIASIDSPTIMFGSGAGMLYYSSLPYRPTDTVQQSLIHFGLVTAIQPHPSQNKYHKNLVLTASLDWSIKIWNSSINYQKPMFEFFSNSYDYVSDAQWSPVHPAMFCMLTSGGQLSLWSLSVSDTDPIDTLSINKDGDHATDGHGKSAPKVPQGNTGAALNKCAWGKDGLSILVADAMGIVHLVMVHPSVAIPNASDIAKFELRLQTRQESLTGTVESKSIDIFSRDDEDDN